MRKPTYALVAAAALAVAAACSDSATTRLAAPFAAPDAASLDRGGNGGSNHDSNDEHQNGYGNSEDNADGHEGHDHDKITICHAAGLAGTTKYVEITVSTHASNAHLDEHGTPRAGHEKDYIEDDNHHGCKEEDTNLSKRLVEVMTTDASGHMIADPTWKDGQPVIIPRGETRWLFYRIDYSLSKSSSGTLSEDRNAVCGTLGSAYHCSFNTGGQYSWSVSGAGSKILQIDLTNNSACDDRTFTNTVVLTPKKGSSVSASSSVVISGRCAPPATLKKTLIRVFTRDASGQMIDDPTWSQGQPIMIPQGETRWLRYRLDWVVPAGVTGTATENEPAVCGPQGGIITGVHCSFNTQGVFSWSASGSNGVEVNIDLTNNSACGTATFTNSAALTTPNGPQVNASAPVVLNLVCGSLHKTLIRVFTRDAAGQMIDDPNWSAGQDISIPRGETRWLRYRLDWSLPSAQSGVVTDDEPTVCGAQGGIIPGVHCSFNTQGVFSWAASGTSSVEVNLDLTNNSGCGQQTFTNKAVLALTGGTRIDAEAPVRLNLACQ